MFLGLGLMLNSGFLVASGGAVAGPYDEQFDAAGWPADPTNAADQAAWIAAEQVAGDIDFVDGEGMRILRDSGTHSAKAERPGLFSTPATITVSATLEKKGGNSRAALAFYERNSDGTTGTEILPQPSNARFQTANGVAETITLTDETVTVSTSFGIIVRPWNRATSSSNTNRALLRHLKMSPNPFDEALPVPGLKTGAELLRNEVGTYVGETSTVIGVSSWWDGTVTSYSVVPTVPFTMSGGNMIFAPTSPMARTQLTIFAHNSSGRAPTGMAVNLTVEAAPATLAAANPSFSVSVETAANMETVGFRKLFTGGVEPFTYTNVTNTISWVQMQKGSCSGKAGAVTAAATHTVQCVDGRGDSATVDIVVTVTSVASRTPTFTPTTKTALTSWFSTSWAPGARLHIPNNGVNFGVLNIQNKDSSASRTFITADAGAIIERIHLEGCTGWTVEGVFVAGSKSNGWSTKKNTDCIQLQASTDIRLNGVVVEGEPLTGLTSGVDGWQGTGTEAYDFGGIVIRNSTRIVVENCEASKVKECITGALHNFDINIVDNDFHDFGDDGMYIQRFDAFVIMGNTIGPQSGLYQGTWHKDGIQCGVSPNSDDFHAHGLAIVGNVVQSTLQGILLNNEQYTAGTKHQPKESFYIDLDIRDNGIMAFNSAHGLSTICCEDANVANNAVIGHPVAATDPALNLRFESWLSFVDNVVERTIETAKNLDITKSGNIILEDETYDSPTIFPDLNTGATLWLKMKFETSFSTGVGAGKGASWMH